MADVPPEFETTDELGETRQYSGTVGVTPVAVPPSIFRAIDAFLIRCPSQSPNTRRLEVSLNGGANWMSLAPGEYVGWIPKKDTSGNDIKQVLLRGNTAGVQYEVIINFSQS